MNLRRFLFVFLLLTGIAHAAEAPAAPVGPFKFRVTGLFSKERIEDLRKVVEALPGLALGPVDFETAEATFLFEPAKLFPGAKPEQIRERLDNRIRSASNSTLGVKALSSTPREQWTHVEFPVAGLDCQACALALYEAIAKLDGVVQATVNFREGQMTASIEPGKATKSDVEAVLKKLGVQPKPAEAEKPK